MAQHFAKHLAAVVAPFAEDDTVDEHALRAVCRHALDVDRVDGLVVNAHASEVDSMTIDERIRMVEIAGEESRQRGARIVSGVVPFPGSNAGGVATAHAMQEAGADGLLLLGPGWFTWNVGMVPEAVAGYVHDVASAVTIPCLYFIAGDYTGIKYTPEMVKAICSTDNVIGIKDTMWTEQGFDANLAAIRELDKPISVLTGNDTHLLHNFRSGADGTLLILHCLLGGPIIEMFDAVRDGDTARAAKINKDHERLIEVLFRQPMIRMPSRMKYALYLTGVIPDDRTRAPVPPPSEEDKQIIQEELLKLGMIGQQAIAAAGE